MRKVKTRKHDVICVKTKTHERLEKKGKNIIIEGTHLSY